MVGCVASRQSWLPEAQYVAPQGKDPAGVAHLLATSTLTLARLEHPSLM